MKILTIEVKRPNERFHIPLMGRADELAGKLEGHKLSELGVCTVIRSWQEARDVIDFLTIAQHCFPKVEDLEAYPDYHADFRKLTAKEAAQLGLKHGGYCGSLEALEKVGFKILKSE